MTRTVRPTHRSLARARARYPIWSAQAVMWLSGLVMVITTVLVFLIGKRELLVRAEITAGVLAGLIFVFLTFGLYRGVRVRKTEQFDPKPDIGLDLWRFDSMPDPGDVLPDIDIGEGCVGAIIGFVLSVLAFILIMLLLWVLVVLGVSVLIFVFAGVYWVLHLALRTVFAKSRLCRGKLGRSLRTALVYTFLYTAWIFALLITGQLMLQKHLY